MFQKEVHKWVSTCFGKIVALNVRERSHRFLEEAIELSQSCHCTEKEAIELVKHVFSKPKGEVFQEVGGVMVTLAALCNANNIEDMESAGRKELGDNWKKIEEKREKHNNKPLGSPLPGTIRRAALTEKCEYKNNCFYPNCECKTH